MSARRDNVFLRLAAIGLGMAVGQAALAATEEARSATRAAEALVARGQFQEAMRQLSAVDCGSDKACRTLVDFGYGWLFESWSSADRANEQALLTRSRDYYQRASVFTPGNAQILTNLALVSRRMGDLDTAVESLTEALRIDPDATGERYLLLGTILADAGDLERALGAWRAAVEQNPRNKAAHQRLLEAWRRAGAHRELYRHSLAIRDSLPELAATGLGYAMQLGARADPRMADDALATWTAIRSNLGVLGPPHLDALPAPSAWGSTGYAELRDVVMRPGPPPEAGELDWWRARAERRDAMARLFRLKGSALRTDAGRHPAMSEERRERLRLAVLYLKAAVDFAPPFEAYLGGNLGKASNVRLDAATDLVAIHYSLEEEADVQSLADLSRDDLEQMTQILFSGKAGAYASGQLAAIQRYHTVLGMIYYATGRLSSGAADNATFQLEHAISMGQRIARQDATSYKPVPELQGLLADVYRIQGKASDSGRLFLDASMGYLETDNLAAAEAALRNARNQGADPARADAISTVLGGRVAVEASGAALFETTPVWASVGESPRIAWVADPASLGLPARFVEGQRFKVLADLGTAVAEAGNPEAARQLNAQALHVFTGQTTLLSPTDLRRLQNIDKSISATADSAPQGSTDISRGTGLRETGRQGWVIPSSTGEAVITIDEKVLDESRSILLQKRLQNDSSLREEQ